MRWDLFIFTPTLFKITSLNINAWFIIIGVTRLQRSPSWFSWYCNTSPLSRAWKLCFCFVYLWRATTENMSWSWRKKQWRQIQWSNNEKTSFSNVLFLYEHNGSHIPTAQRKRCKSCDIAALTWRLSAGEIIFFKRIKRQLIFGGCSFSSFRCCLKVLQYQ